MPPKKCPQPDRRVIYLLAQLINDTDLVVREPETLMDPDILACAGLLVHCTPAAILQNIGKMFRSLQPGTGELIESADVREQFRRVFDNFAHFDNKYAKSQLRWWEKSVCTHYHDLYLGELTPFPGPFDDKDNGQHLFIIAKTIKENSDKLTRDEYDIRRYEQIGETIAEAAQAFYAIKPLADSEEPDF